MYFNKNVVKMITSVTLLMLLFVGVHVTTIYAAELQNGNWKVEKGDTLSEIGQQTGLSVATIESLNPKIDPLTLTIGYELRLKKGAEELDKAKAESEKKAVSEKAAQAEAVVAVEHATEEVAPAAPAVPVEPTPAPVVEPAFIGSFAATYYTAFDGNQIGITANGTDVRNGQTLTPEGYRIIAADPAVLPLNTVVQITTGNGESFTAKVCDTGGAINGNRIDILVGSLAEAMQLGRTQAEISHVY